MNADNIGAQRSKGLQINRRFTYIFEFRFHDKIYA